MDAATLQGAAVKAGVLCARGERVLFADADGATVITGVEALEQRLNEAASKGRGLAVGSRAHMQQEVSVLCSLRFLRMWTHPKTQS